MPELKASPRNRALGLLADALSGAKSAADTVQLPVVGGLGSLLFGDAPELVNDVAYYGPQALVRGGNAATGGLGTFAPDRRVLDAIGVAPMAPGAVRVAKTALNPMTYGRAFVEAQAPAVMSPITAWHGSPHKFRKFDNSKMGTGEGAQAYGAGAYLADAKPIAESYRDVLASPKNNLLFTDKRGITIERSQFDDGLTIGVGRLEDRMLDQTGVNVKYPFDEVFNTPQEALEFAKSNGLLSNADLENLKAYKVHALDRTTKEVPLSEITPSSYDQFIITDPGYLYKADIPDEAVANMLLWDKPLSEQPEAVRKAINTINEDALSKYRQSLLRTEPETLNKTSISAQEKSLLDSILNDPYFLEMERNAPSLEQMEQQRIDAAINSMREILSNKKGSGYYKELSGIYGTPEATSQKLSSLGIPGIRYLDAGSRGQGAGTMNTVVFDDSIIKILERNGVPLGLLAD